MYQGLSVPSAQEQEMELLSVGAAFLFLALLWVPYRCVYAFVEERRGITRNFHTPRPNSIDESFENEFSETNLILFNQRWELGRSLGRSLPS